MAKRMTLNLEKIQVEASGEKQLKRKFFIGVENTWKIVMAIRGPR